MPSLKEPVAVNCCVLPTVTLGVAGVIASETNVPVPTVKVAVPVRPDAVEDFQLNPLRFVAVLPSLKVPVAVNFSDVPFAILGFAGLIVINVRCAIETVN